MDHSDSAASPFTLLFSSFDISIECRDDIDYETVNNRRGPGTALDRVFDFVGRRIDRSLSKAAVRAGYGPVVTAEKIRRRIDCTSGHCFIRRCKNYPHSLPSTKVEVDKLQEDVKRLLKYVKYVARNFPRDTSFIMS